MTKRKPSAGRATGSGDPERSTILPQPPTVAGATPLVFISHDSRDSDLAEAFDHLLTDASGGVIQTFRSFISFGRSS